MAGALCFAGAAFAQTQAEKKSDATFLKKDAQDGMYQVEMGQLAVEHAKNADVKAYRKRMLADHSRENEEIKALAEKKGVKLPGKTREAKWKSDKDYMDAMVKHHVKDLAEYKEEMKDGSDPDVKAFAQTNAKMIEEEHLKLAREIQSKLEEPAAAKPANLRPGGKQRELARPTRTFEPKDHHPAYPAQVPLIANLRPWKHPLPA